MEIGGATSGVRLANLATQDQAITGVGAGQAGSGTTPGAITDVYGQRLRPDTLPDRAAEKLGQISDFGRSLARRESAVTVPQVSLLDGSAPKGAAVDESAAFKFDQLMDNYVRASRYNQELVLVGSTGGNMTKSIKTLMTSS